MLGYMGLIADLPLGQAGFNANHNISQVQPGELIQANNLTYESGTLQKEGGSALYTGSPLSGTPTVYGGVDYWPDSATQRSVIVAGTTILKDANPAGTYATTLKSGLTIPILPPVFVEGGKEASTKPKLLFIYTGGTNDVQMLSGDGVTTSGVTTPPTDWSGKPPIAGCIHQNRHIATGTAFDPFRIYYSDNSDHTNFTNANAGAFPCYPGQGIANYAVVPFKGQLIIFRYPFGIYAANMQDPSPTNWNVSRITDKVGICSPRAWAFVNDDILFMDVSGKLRLLSTVIQFGSYGLAGVGDQQYMYNFIKDNINPSRLQHVGIIYYNYKQEVHMTMSQTSSNVNNIRLVMDMNSSVGPRFRYSDKDSHEALWTALDATLIPRLYGGDHAGQVWTLDQATKSVGTNGYTATFQTAHYDLGGMSPFLTGTPKPLSAIQKAWDFLELVVEPKGNWNLTVDIYHEGDFFETVSFNMGSTGATLGSFILDSSTLGSDEIKNQRRRIHGVSHRISFVGYNSGANQDFSIAKMLLYFRPLSENAKATS